MAKAATPAPAASASVAGFTIETAVALPTITRAIGKTSSPYTAAMEALALPAPYDANKLQSFFIPATAADNITDATEKAKALKEDARKIANRVSGVSRRLVKADATRAYAIRSMTDAKGNVGVRVFRVQPEAPKPTAAA